MRDSGADRPVARARIGPGRVALALVVTAALAAGAFFGAPRVAGPLLTAPVHWRLGEPLPEVPAVLPPLANQAPPPTSAGVGAAVAPLVTGAALGGTTTVSVRDVATGESLYQAGAETQLVPASTTKIITAVTVLAARGPAYRLATTAVAGAREGEVVLVGGGDSTLAPGPDGAYPGAARLDELAAQVLTARGGAAPTKVSYDVSLFSGEMYAPGWDSGIAEEGYGAPIKALTVDGARTVPHADPHAPTQPPRQRKPDLVAAQAFAKALGLPPAGVTEATALPGARQLGKVESPPLARLVETMLLDSDNVLAEALARQVALARGEPATFAGAVAAMKTVLGELGVDTAGFGLADGSGLSRAGRLSAAILTGVLSVAAGPSHPQVHAAFAGLPVAGYSGTLNDRYRKANAGREAAGSVRAKTGTLAGDGVHALAGTVVDTQGRVLAFAVLANGVAKPVTTAREAIDRIPAALGRCGCR